MSRCMLPHVTTPLDRIDTKRKKNSGYEIARIELSAAWAEQYFFPSKKHLLLFCSRLGYELFCIFAYPVIQKYCLFLEAYFGL